jgi:ubiquinone/menaquinone biosynthesis C-methylase UbiE
MPLTEDLHQRIRRAVRSHFEDSPGPYDAFEERYGFFRSLTDALLERMQLAPGADVLDIGCGTGASCRRILERLPGSRVWGLDFSPAMLAKARMLMAAVPGRLHLVEGDAGSLRDAVQGPFDGIVYSASIFLIPNFEKSLAQALRLLRSGGCLGLTFMDGVYDRRGDNAFAAAEDELRTGISLKKPVRLDRLQQVFEQFFADTRCDRLGVPASRSFLVDFFSVPAMSAGLYPGRPYPRRLQEVQRMIRHFEDTDHEFRWILMTGAAP